MKCKSVRKRLTAFTDGELAEEDRRSVSDHLAECEACRQHAREVEKVLVWAEMWQDREPSPGFQTRLKARARAAEKPAVGWFRLPWARTAMAGLAAACLVFLFGYLTGVSFLGRKLTTGSAPVVSRPVRPTDTGKQGPGGGADSERLIVGLQKIKMVFGSKLSDAALAQLDEVQRTIAARDTAYADSPTVVAELQRAEQLVREKRLAQARTVLDGIEDMHPGHPLASYARLTKILATPEPRYRSDLFNSAYAKLLRDTVMDPAGFYNELTGFQAQVTEYGWQKIVDSADRLNPLNVLDYLENRLVGGGESL